MKSKQSKTGIRVASLLMVTLACLSIGYKLNNGWFQKGAQEAEKNFQVTYSFDYKSPCDEAFQIKAFVPTSNSRQKISNHNNDFQQGVNRGDLRVRKTVDKSIHPQGNTWSHVLDAEPLSLTANSNSFTFVLWRKGIYNLSVDAIENWRSPEPTWKKLAKIPRAMETVGTTCDEQYFESWSKGGGIIRFDIQSGKTIESKIIPIDGYLEAVFKHGEHYLLQLNNSIIAIYEAGEIKLTAKLSGPINYAEWSEDDQGWHIAGWRELAFISAKTMSRTQLSEIAVYIDGNSGIYLCNDGTWDIIDAQEEE